jgi:hypothetical protein
VGGGDARRSVEDVLNAGTPRNTAGPRQDGGGQQHAERVFKGLRIDLAEGGPDDRVVGAPDDRRQEQQQWINASL